jgi:uncharacterized membrane protein required for colicin V production
LTAERDCDLSMIESILLDLLLVLIVLLMMAIGIYRGGLREAFSAAGIILGVLLAQEWSGRWGNWIGGNTNLSDGGARFAVAVGLLVVVTAAVGYGVGSSFNYHPGPGGRMFGAVLGAGGALIAIAYVLTWLRIDLFDGDEPDVLADTYIARYLDGDAGSVLLAISGAIVIGAMFGSFVRERQDVEDEPAPVAGPPRPAVTREQAPDKVEPSVVETQQSMPVQVRPSRHWEDRAGSMPQRADREWSNTWPSDAPGVPRHESPSRAGEVQQARDRRRTQRSGDEQG